MPLEMGIANTFLKTRSVASDASSPAPRELCLYNRHARRLLIVSSSARCDAPSRHPSWQASRGPLEARFCVGSVMLAFLLLVFAGPSRFGSQGGRPVVEKIPKSICGSFLVIPRKFVILFSGGALPYFRRCPEVPPLARSIRIRCFPAASQSCKRFGPDQMEPFSIVFHDERLEQIQGSLSRSTRPSRAPSQCSDEARF